MNRSRSVDVLSRMLGQQHLSLVHYILASGAYVAPGQEHLAECLRKIATRRHAMAARIADAILERRGRLPGRTFPASYTSLNDLDLKFLVHRVWSAQPGVVADLAAFVVALNGDPAAQALAHEVLAQEREHATWLTAACAAESPILGSSRQGTGARPPNAGIWSPAALPRQTHPESGPALSIAG